MPHPILKKSRGPSTSGPRPTARFISPHDSEDGGPSPTSPNSHVVVQPPSPNREAPNNKADKKPSTSGTGKRQGFVASNASKKKRPAIVRRKSSQSSNEPTKGIEAQQSSSERFVSRMLLLRSRPSFASLISLLWIIIDLTIFCRTPPTLSEPVLSQPKVKGQPKSQESMYMICLNPISTLVFS
jgi:hypothetical protein